MKPLLNTSKITSWLEQVINIFDMETGTKSIKEFINRVEVLSQQFVSEDDPDNKAVNAFKGDITELLAEIFFGAFGNSPRVGLINYHPVPLSEDYGVDGIGQNVNGDAVAVQVKFRSNPLDYIDYASMARTYTAGRIKHGMYLDRDNTLFLFTTTYDVTPPCKAVFGNILRVIDQYIIAGYIDNNISFWKEAEERIGATLDSLNAQT
jgi:hypothetical protein